MISQNDQHYGLGDPAMLEKIDKLLACGVGEYIDLPQIVVVGDQSSGKSSVLEGLIRMPLDRDSGLCTRFATQIVFRRASEESLSISIIPDPSATQEHRDTVLAWSKTELKELDPASFAATMTEVHEVMGLSRTPSALTTSIFSNDVLRLEISGRNEEHLTVIDVPGIFKNTTPGLTTKTDISLVRSMVQGYMENPRSVMLTVVPANVDIATQEILELAADVDPDGRRTLGVLTKPDLVDKGAETRVVDLMEGRAHPMKLGWHLVRNPGQQQLSDQSLNRQTLESDFFRNETPWKALDREKVGIESLRSRLQQILSSLVRQVFPKVKQEINRRLTLTRRKLLDLGIERNNTEKQSAYLTDVATRYERLVSLAKEAKYGQDEFFDDEDMSVRLATIVTERNATFSDEFGRWGQEYHFTTSTDSQQPKDEDESLPSGLDWEAADDNSLNNSRTFSVRKYDNITELEDILHPDDALPATNGRSIAKWLHNVYRTSRGFELGTFDSSILATTMKKQSAKWTSIALGYISDIVVITHKFLMKVLATVCQDARVQSELLAALADGLAERYRKAINQVVFLLAIERTGTPMTLNHYFNNNLEKCRQKRMQAMMAGMSFSDCDHGTVVRLEDVMHNHPMSNTQHVVQDLHDILFSYYKVARKRFVDNVCMHAADNFLINGAETPLNFFSPTFVNRLNAEQLEFIAGEDQTTRRSRAQLSKEVQSLEDAKKILS